MHYCGEHKNNYISLSLLPIIVMGTVFKVAGYYQPTCTVPQTIHKFMAPLHLVAGRKEEIAQTTPWPIFVFYP